MKNVILLAMSTLKVNGCNKLCQNSYNCEIGNINDKFTGYSQLEPVTKFFVRTIYEDEKQYPDKIVVLCTPETMNEEHRQCFSIQDSMGSHKKEQTAYEFFREQIQWYVKERYGYDLPDNIFIPVPIDPDHMKDGICKAAIEIRKVQQQNTEKVQLWLNTQGSFREITFVMIAISTLLENQYIKVKNIVSVQYQDKQNSELREQLDTYKILSFVSGMNAFIRYSRVDQLKEYYEWKKSYIDKEPDEMPIIDQMEQFAEALQFCNPQGLEKTLENLRNEISKYEEQVEEKDDFFVVFIDEVKKQYGNVLAKNKFRSIDLVKWLYDNKFYQQALTYIEAEIPKKIIGAEGEGKLLTYIYNIGEGMTKTEFETEIKKIAEKKGKKKENIFLEKFTNGDFETLSNLKDGVENIEKFRDGKIEGFKGHEGYWEPGQEKEIIRVRNSTNQQEGMDRSSTVTVRSNCKNSITFQHLLYLYRLLKSARNRINHFDGDRNEDDSETVKHAIELFIEIGGELIKE